MKRFRKVCIFCIVALMSIAILALVLYEVTNDVGYLYIGFIVAMVGLCAVYGFENAENEAEKETKAEAEAEANKEEN